ncbi:hypothetical protein B0T14DRAFT_604700 [Immersiella caudata]|uniref:DUF6594 domain-containing protein n=1 Tax=Immersiella caudata TaxID=314043 RepID=A0AA40BWK1_9PEZI|nr:hypothetical protein B0T14DRAFT_604700 [Immersiella caudata]
MATQTPHLPSNELVNPQQLREMEEIELDETPRHGENQNSHRDVGYSGFAAFLSSDDDVFILRRFDMLHARVLLTLKDDLSSLEQDLCIMDAGEGNSGAGGSTIRGGPAGEEGAYGQGLSETARVRRTPFHLHGPPRSTEALTSLRQKVATWLNNMGNPIDAREALFIRADDLVTVVDPPRDITP